MRYLELENASQTRTPRQTVTVMLVSSDDEDCSRLRRIFEHTNWVLVHARNYEEAVGVLGSTAVPVVVTEAWLPGKRSWQDLLELRFPSGRPRLIVTTAVLDEPLWAEVLNLGGYDVLMKPFDQAEVIRLISLAWLNWKDEQSTGERDDGNDTKRVDEGYGRSGARDGGAGAGTGRAAGAGRLGLGLEPEGTRARFLDH